MTHKIHGDEAPRIEGFHEDAHEGRWALSGSDPLKRRARRHRENQELRKQVAERLATGEWEDWDNGE